MCASGPLTSANIQCVFWYLDLSVSSPKENTCMKGNIIEEHACLPFVILEGNKLFTVMLIHIRRPHN